jgi:hypothetical protein
MWLVTWLLQLWDDFRVLEVGSLDRGDPLQQMNVL